ncbi:MAG TPA: SAM-dependent methyltransferase [Opitutaceae bacterium]|nr:SAM-dependent methyltransferase [Opitutaceae bacterium]
MAQPSARDRFVALLRTSIEQGSLVKLTLGKYRGKEEGLRNVFVRPVTLKAGPHLSFVFRYARRDVTKNQIPAEALTTVERLLDGEFLDAHLFTPAQTAQLTTAEDGTAKLHLKTASAAPTPVLGTHDKIRNYLVPPDSSWLRALGVTNERGQPREAMAAKYRQINRFVELVSHLTDEASLPADRPFRIVDMGCGKGYLTFAMAAFFGTRAEVVGVEARRELVALCNDVAAKEKFENLRFVQGSIAEMPQTEIDVLVALHACDTATDDALFQGVSANAALLIVSPCCQKELRPQLTAPAVLSSALKHGIFQERQAEFVTDALRAELLEWAGYRTKVFEFISTEHTAKNLMIAAVRERQRGDAVVEKRIQQLAAFYGIRQQRLAGELGVKLNADAVG